jgi:hypothetical protein
MEDSIFFPLFPFKKGPGRSPVVPLAVADAEGSAGPVYTPVTGFYEKQH